MKRLQVLQNKTLRLKIHGNRYMSTKDLVAKSGELSVNQLIAYHTLLQIHKTILSQQPEYIYKNINIKVPGQNQPFPLRQAYTLNTNRNLSISRAGFMHRGCHIWNMLPLQLRKCDKTPTFKTQVKKWVQNFIPIRPS